MKTTAQQLTELKEKLAELEAKLEKDTKKEWPQVGDKYWYVYADGDIASERWDNNSGDNRHLNNGNAFPTETAAKRALLRRQAAYKKWLPKEDETYYYIDLSDHLPSSDDWGDGNSTGGFSNYFLGNTHKTEAAAQDWWDKYKDGFTLDNNEL